MIPALSRGFLPAISGYAPFLFPRSLLGVLYASPALVLYSLDNTLASIPVVLPGVLFSTSCYIPIDISSSFPHALFDSV